MNFTEVKVNTKDYENYIEILNWCVDNIPKQVYTNLTSDGERMPIDSLFDELNNTVYDGVDKIRVDMLFHNSKTSFYFKDNDIASFFKLTWGGEYETYILHI